MELPWLINIPSGGAHGSEGNLGAVVAGALSCYLVSHNMKTDNIILIMSIVFSLGISRIGFFLVNLIRKANLNLTHYADEAIKHADFKKIARLNMTGVWYIFIMGFILTGTGFTLGTYILKPLIYFIHSDFNHAFEMAKFGILGLGFGAVATLFLTKDTKWYVIAGVTASVIILFFINS